MTRLAVALVMLLAFVARIVAPDAAMAGARLDAGGSVPQQCSLHPVAPDGVDPAAPLDGGAQHKHSACPICQIGWAPPSALPALVIVESVSRRAAITPPRSELRFGFRFNLGAPTRGPPSLV